VFEDRMQCKIFGSKMDKVISDWRRLHIEEVHELYFAPNATWMIKLRMRWAGHVARMGQTSGGYKVSMGAIRGEKTLRISGCRRV
jgi:hypothetical protein